jgi:hypothetical protein
MKTDLPKIEMVSLDSIHKNPDNPRIIKDDKFKKLVESIKNFPEMLNIRTIVVDQEMMILGGNMRYEACKAAGLKEVPIIIADFTEEQKREFTIKDNVPFGEFNWSELANEWDVSELEEWGLDVIKPVKIFGDTSTDREKQGVNSTWDAVKSSENVKIIIGQLESSIPSVLAKKIILYLENKFDNDEIPIKESIITVLECGINNFED